MVDESQLRRRVLLRFVGSPIVIAPALVGFSAGVLSWAASWNPGLGAFAALAGLLGTAGAYLTRVIMDDGRTAQKVLAEMENEAQADSQRNLDDLDRRLVSADQDPRPEAALRDLRALLRAFDEAAGQAPPEHQVALIEMRSQAGKLFDSSVRSLEQTMKLYDTARRLQMPDARLPLMEQRERVIEDIQAGVTQLGRTLAAVQQLTSGGQNTSHLSRLREDLDQSLRTANRVEERINSLLETGVTGDTEPMLRAPAEQQTSKG